jgi:hypothetical protein
LNEDFRDILRALLATQAQFIVVGAYAVAAHGIARATGDLDIWVAPQPDNAERVWRALVAFGAPVESMGVHLEDLATEGMVVQIGLAPRRVDLLTSLTGATFRDAWEERVEHEVDGLRIPFLGRATLLKNKRAVGRPQDLADVDALEGGSAGKKDHSQR